MVEPGGAGQAVDSDVVGEEDACDVGCVWRREEGGDGREDLEIVAVGVIKAGRVEEGEAG